MLVPLVKRSPTENISRNIQVSVIFRSVLIEIYVDGTDPERSLRSSL